jgi:hypothetical protein
MAVSVSYFAGAIRTSGSAPGTETEAEIRYGASWSRQDRRLGRPFAAGVPADISRPPRLACKRSMM